MAATIERLTPRRGHGTVTEYPVAAATKIYAGTIVATNSSGYAGPVTAGAFATALLGVAEETADNSHGQAGDVRVRVRRQCAFKLDNATTNPVVQATTGLKAGIVDDVTVNNGTGATLDPGVTVIRVENVEPDGVWVWID